MRTEAVDGTLAGKQLRTEETDEGWVWVWGVWRSAPFHYLEYRPWTPLVIGERLCFSARRGEKWLVVWGDEEGPEFDDVFDTIDVDGEPVYQARVGREWFLVKGDRLVTERVPYQLSFRLGAADVVEVKPFDSREGWRPAKWKSL